MLGEDEWQCVLNHSDIYSICNLRAVSRVVRRVALHHIKTILIPNHLAYMSAMRCSVHASSPTRVLAKFLQRNYSERSGHIVMYICATCRKSCDGIATCDCHIHTTRRMQHLSWFHVIFPPLISLAVCLVIRSKTFLI